MRTACWIGACFGLLAWTLNASAQSSETGWGKATIVLPQVDAWSGPNQEKNYPTIQIRKSAEVVVKCDKNGKPIKIEDVNPQHPGWFEIKPPLGSFSWIHQRFLKNLSGPTFVVTGGGPVGIYVGSALAKEEPKVEKVQLPADTQVIVLSQPVPSKQGGYYYPIQSPDTEPRYIPANAINLTKVTPVSPAAPPSGVAQVSSNVTAPANSYNDLVTKADTAERLGETGKAKALYEAAQRATNDPQQKAYVASRLDSLQKSTAANAWTAPGGGPNRQVAGTTALYTTNKAASAARSLVPGQRQWTEWGTLQRTGLHAEDGQEIYRLLDVNGSPIAYATAQTGYTLSNYAGRFITLYGMVSASTDDALRLMRISVQHVSLKQ
jgi:hypothetical protein